MYPHPWGVWELGSSKVNETKSASMRRQPCKSQTCTVCPRPCVCGPSRNDGSIVDRLNPFGAWPGVLIVIVENPWEYFVSNIYLLSANSGQPENTPGMVVLPFMDCAVGPEDKVSLREVPQ